MSETTKAKPTKAEWRSMTDTTIYRMAPNGLNTVEVNFRGTYRAVAIAYAHHVRSTMNMLESAATALNVDPVELAKGIDVAGMVKAMEALLARFAIVGPDDEKSMAVRAEADRVLSNIPTPKGR